MIRARSLATLLAGGDRRSIGGANAIAERLTGDPKLVAEAVRLLRHDDPILVLRAADALEKASARVPGILRPHRARLLKLMAQARQQELVWHLAQMLPRLALTEIQVRAAARWLAATFHHHESRIARVNALQALADLARRHVGIRPLAARVLTAAAESPMGSVAARARRLARGT